MYNNLVIPSPTSLTYPWYLTKETKYHHALLTNLVNPLKLNMEPVKLTLLKRRCLCWTPIIFRFHVKL